jgi:hypothetical protein
MKKILTNGDKFTSYGENVLVIMILIGNLSLWIGFFSNLAIPTFFGLFTIFTSSLTFIAYGQHGD